MRPRPVVESIRRGELLQGLRREHLVASKRQLTGGRAHAGLIRTRARSVSRSGRSTLTSTPARRNPASTRCLPGRVGELVFQELEDHIFRPRLPKRVGGIIAVCVPVTSSTVRLPREMRFSEIHRARLACALGRCAHRHDARGVECTPGRGRTARWESRSSSQSRKSKRSPSRSFVFAKTCSALKPGSPASATARILSETTAAGRAPGARAGARVQT